MLFKPNERKCKILTERLYATKMAGTRGKKLSPLREFRNSLIESDLLIKLTVGYPQKGMFTQKVVSQYARLFEDKDRFIRLLLQR